MATRVGRKYISVTSLNCLTFITPSLVQVIASYVIKFPNFRYHGKRSRSDVNINVTVKMPDLKNPLFGATTMALSLILAEF